MKNILPDISIIICNFNHAKWLERCLRSVINQESIEPNMFEIILVDDKSNDASLEVIKNIYTRKLNPMICNVHPLLKSL